MVQANDKPDKKPDRLTKELNKLKTDFNNEGKHGYRFIQKTVKE